MLKILLGVGLGFLLFTNQDARQITADLLRTTGDAIAPADEDRTLEDLSLIHISSPRDGLLSRMPSSA